MQAFLGNGFQEVIYQRALALEMKTNGLNFARELSVPVFYHEVKIATRRVDFLVQDRVLVEIKAVGELNDNQMPKLLITSRHINWK